MAEIKVITVSKGVTISVGQYESVRIDAQLEIRGDEGEDPDQLFEIGYETIDEKINDQITEIQEIVGKNSMFRYEKEENKKSTRKRGGK